MGRRLDEEHCKKVAAKKSRFLENLRNTRHKTGGCFYLLKKDFFFFFFLPSFVNTQFLHIWIMIAC